MYKNSIIKWAGSGIQKISSQIQIQGIKRHWKKIGNTALDMYFLNNSGWMLHKKGWIKLTSSVLDPELHESAFNWHPGSGSTFGIQI
jgi:hypothetical protein